MDLSEITVKVNYKVGLAELDIPNEVYKELEMMFDNVIELDGLSEHYPLATEWLKNNITETDCFDIKYIIDDFR